MTKAQKFFEKELGERGLLTYIEVNAQRTSTDINNLVSVEINHNTDEMTVRFTEQTMTACIEDTQAMIDAMEIVQALDRTWHWYVMSEDEKG